MYIHVLSQVSRMQWGISKDVFNTNHNWPQLGFSFHVSKCFSNCLKRGGCFLLTRPPRSALRRGLLALGTTTVPKQGWPQLPAEAARLLPRAASALEPARGHGKLYIIILQTVCIPGATYCRGFFALGGPSAYREEVPQVSACWFPV